nr:chemotaxis response regulator protein-glutamate methylesterase [uncultured Faecalimonas sp.]
MLTKKIKVLIVDDSSLFRQMMIQFLSSQSDIEVVGYAINAYDARQKIPKLHPDVVTLDVEMPGMNGIEFLKQLLPSNPLPVILVSSLNLSVFDALSAGAVDFVRKPDMSMANSKNLFFSTLLSKLRIASISKVRIKKPVVSAPLPSVSKASPASLNSTIIGIGASTGGTEATLAVLQKLPAQVPGIVITQHMPEGFTAMYAERLNRICKIEVREAKNGDLIRPGLALIAPGAMQMEVIHTVRGYAVQCHPGAKVSGHCPSVDVLFSSIAKNVACSKIGIIMTGMGRDGADGLLKMRQKGAFTIGQDKESCVVYGMPMAAYNIGAVTIQSSCENIPSVLMNHLRKQ